MKFKNPASRFALVGVFVADFGGGGKDAVRVAVTGAGACAFSARSDMEKALSQKFAPHSVAGIKVKPDGLNNDLHASPEYRAHLITVMAKLRRRGGFEVIHISVKKKKKKKKKGRRKREVRKTRAQNRND